mgnify:CR=1 FL=1
MQLEMGPHFAYLASAYAAVLIAVVGYTGSLIARGRSLERRAGAR